MVKSIIFDFDGVIADTFEKMYELHLQFRPESNREKYREYFEGNFY